MSKDDSKKASEDAKSSTTVEWMKIDDLQRDPEINVRPIDEKRAKVIAAEFDPDAFGVPEASVRSDGSNIILDGQHRIEALRFMGWNGQKVPVKLHHGLTRAEEAAMFIRLNTQKAISFLDKFLSRITAKDKVACAVSEIVKQNGYCVDRFARDGVIVAASSLENIYTGKNQKIRGMNPKALHGTLQAVTEAWGRTSQSVGATVLSGVGAFLLRYGEHVNLERLIETLKAVSAGPNGLVQRGRGKRELHGGTLTMSVAHFIADEYNSGLRGKARLPDWRED